MEYLIRRLSARSELLIVVVFAFGYFMLTSIKAFFFPVPGGPISELHLLTLLSYEAFLMLVLVKFLAIRGWGLKSYGMKPKAIDFLIGVGLYLGQTLVLFIVWTILNVVAPGISAHARNLVSGDIDVFMVIAISLLNPIFEEMFVCGYLITALKKSHSATYAINFSMAVRLIYHLYQGTAGIVNITILGFIYAFWFARTGRLWPLIVTHALTDFIGLMFYIHSGSGTGWQ